MLSRTQLQLVSRLHTAASRALGCVLVLLLAGCVTAPPSAQRQPPAVRLGPLLHLLATSSKLDKVRVIAGPGEQVQVLIASGELRQVFDMSVGPDGTVTQQLIRDAVTPVTVDGAFDAAGRLHVVIDAEHLVRDGQAWRTSAQSVWQDAGLTVERPGFVHGSQHLLWTFTAMGRDMGGTSGRWIWRGGGGGYPAGGFLLFPWYEQTRKAVLVADGPASAMPWNVLDVQGKVDTAISDAVADATGTVHLVYTSGYNVDLAGTDALLSGMVTRGSGKITLHYARVQTTDLEPVSVAAAESTRPMRQLRDISRTRQLDWPYLRIAIAVDPLSGNALLGDHFLVGGDGWQDVHATTPFALGPPPAQLAAAGNDAFHAVAIGNIDQRFMGRSGIKYAMFAHGEWSAPLWLSTAGSLSLLEPTVVSMTSTASGKAFVVWTSTNGIVGRWVEPVR